MAREVRRVVSVAALLDPINVGLERARKLEESAVAVRSDSVRAAAVLIRRGDVEFATVVRVTGIEEAEIVAAIDGLQRAYEAKQRCVDRKRTAAA